MKKVKYIGKMIDFEKCNQKETQFQIINELIEQSIKKMHKQELIELSIDFVLSLIYSYGILNFQQVVILLKDYAFEELCNEILKGVDSKDNRMRVLQNL